MGDRERAEPLLHIGGEHGREAGDARAGLCTATREGKLTAEQWSRLDVKLAGELDAARAQADRLQQQQRALTADIEQIDVETALLNELTALRAMVAGEATEGRREGVDAFRAALRRMFAHFELLSLQGWGHASTEGTISAPHDDLTLDGHVLYPHVRAEMVEGWDYRDAFPALRRASLSLRANDADGLPR